MCSFYWCLNFSFPVFEIHHWSRCWRLCIHHWNSWHSWLASIWTNRYHTHGCRYLWNHWWCVCCTTPRWFEGPFPYENENQRILQDPGYISEDHCYNHSLSCSYGKHPFCLLEFCQLQFMLYAYFCVNSCYECITPSHRTWWTLCEPCQNTRNWSRSCEKTVLMWLLSSNTLGYYFACPPVRKGD